MFQCDGACARSFHFGEMEKKRPEGFCNPLEMSAELAKACLADNVTWLCPNCLANVHQCFACKKDGRSDASRGPQQVFRQATDSSCRSIYNATASWLAWLSRAKAGDKASCNMLCGYQGPFIAICLDPRWLHAACSSYRSAAFSGTVACIHDHRH